MTPKLTIDLIGRICLIRKGNQRWAVFLTANRDANFNTRRSHAPAMSAALDRIKSQEIADRAEVAVGAVTNGSGKQLAESRGVWSVKNLDMDFSGLKTSTTAGPARRIPKLAQLNAIVASVNHPPQFKKAILAKDPPRSAGIAARLKIPKGARISAVAEDNNTRTFMPGGYQQKVADFIRIRIPFLNGSVGPTLRLRKFGTKKSERVKFTGGNNLNLAMSNLCRCVGQRNLQGAGGVAIEDREFVVFYKLLAKPLPKRLRPIPQVPASLAASSSGIFVPECYRPGEGSV